MHFSAISWITQGKISVGLIAENMSNFSTLAFSDFLDFPDQHGLCSIDNNIRT